MTDRDTTPAGDEKQPQVPWPAIGAAFAVMLVLLASFTWLCRDQMNPDAIAYIRIAYYYLHGQWDIAISGYWGVLFTWLLAPLLLVFDDSILAAHVMLAISGVLFAAASVFLFIRVGLRSTNLVVAAWIVCITAAVWSAKNITPDMLNAAFMLAGTGILLGPKPALTRREQIMAGLAFGVGYLAKAVAFPVGIAIILFVTGGRSGLAGERLSAWAKRLGVIYLAFFIIAAPWIGVLSVHFGKPTFSTSGPINFAIAGPPDKDRWHPLSRLYMQPDEGRVALWEEPEALPYESWSPFDSPQYFFYMVTHVYENVVNAATLVKSFDAFGLCLASVVLAFFLGRPWRDSLKRDRWRLALVPVVLSVGVYLPVFAGTQRYYYFIFPLMVAAALGFISSLAAGPPARVMRRVGVLIFLLSWGLVISGPFYTAFAPAPYDAHEKGKAIAGFLMDKGETGPLAGVRLPENTDYYAAFLMRTPSYGMKRDVKDISEVVDSGARVIVVRRSAPVLDDMRNSPLFRPLPVEGDWANVPELRDLVFFVRPDVEKKTVGGPGEPFQYELGEAGE
jgi:4-amino-4-deoxy-L-arabinose transferase-like glycosyltransferase